MENELTAEQLAEKVANEIAKDEEIRAKYKFIRKAKAVDDNGNERVAYFKAPNRMIVGMALAKIDTNVTEACEYIYGDCVIRDVSDWEYFMNNDEAFLGLIGMLQGLIQVKKSTFTS